MTTTDETKLVYLNQAVACTCGWVMYPHQGNFTNGQGWLVQCRNEVCPDKGKWWEVQPYLKIVRKEVASVEK